MNNNRFIITMSLVGMIICCSLTSNGMAQDCVDLGLPSGTLWATCNLGAERPEQYGNYYAWGETTGYNTLSRTFDWTTYALCEQSGTTLTKYCNNSNYGAIDNKTVLELADDAAHAALGGAWRMPTDAEMTELRNNTTLTNETINGIAGRRLASKINGNSIFMPFAGYYEVDVVKNAGVYGNYWTSTALTSNNQAYAIWFPNSGAIRRGGINRCYAQSIRPVKSNVVCNGSCGDNVTYTIYSDMSMVISGTGPMTDFDINYDDYAIIRENNDYWTQVKTVTIEEGVTSIGYNAFLGCAELTSVSIPNSVNSIGFCAFIGCRALTSITIPASVETIGADALLSSGLTHIYIEDSDEELQFEKVTPLSDDEEDLLEYVYLGRNIKTIDFHEYNPWEGVGGYPPFSYSRNLHTLEIGDKVTYLEDWSFSGAPLQSLVIGSNVQSIGIRALSSANEGQTLVIPSNVKRMGDYSLSPSISTLVLEKGDEDLELFAGYKSLELSFFGSESSIDSIYVGRNLTCSSNNVHVECRSACFDASLNRIMNTSGEEEEIDLNEYYIPPVCATNYYFGSEAFVGDYYFQNSPVEHVYNLKSSRVGNSAFFNSNVKTISFDAEGSTTIGDGVFYGCDSLTTLSFPEGMTDIGECFMNCYGLTSITIPSSLQSIGGYCFFMDDTERNVSFNVYISDLSAWCRMDIGWEGSPLIWGHLIYNGEEITNLVIPDDVQTIGMGAFEGWSSLSSVIIPKSVASIGERAFYCTGLTSVKVEWTDPLAIEDSTFEEVDKSNCILYVPFGTKSAYESAEVWGEFENIKEYFNADGLDILATGECGADGDNVTYTIYSDMTMVISGTGEMQDYNNEAHINDDYYQSIHKVIIEDGVTNIGYLVFSGCTGLTSIEIPNSVTSIGGYAFEDCTGLTSIEIPNSVTSFGGSVFQGCTGLTSIEMPNSVTSLGGADFWGCTSLASVVLSNGLRYIEMHTFQNCTSLTTIEIPNSVTVLGDCAFGSCTSLTTIELPSSVKTIGSETFGGCTSLTSIEIPNSVTSIGDAFYRCTGLTSITVGWETPLSLPYYSSVFNHFDKTACTLYVPFGTKSAYENAAGWSDFQNIVELDTDLSALTNAIYVNRTEGRIGGTMDIPVNIKSSYPVRGFQFAMELPEGAIINSWALSTDRLPSGATTSDKIAAQNITGNKITMACSLNYGTAAFTGNDGVVATINVTFPDDMEPGSYPIYLTSCDVNDASGKDEDLSDVKATLVLDDYLPGDANGDGKVRIGDATTILNYIVGSVSDSFKEKAADANGDGKIRIGDSTTILNIIVNQ